LACTRFGKKEIHSPKEKTKIYINPYIVENFSTGWFNGASQCIRAMSGVGLKYLRIHITDGLSTVAWASTPGQNY